MKETESALLIISAASGVGKSSLARALVAQSERTVLSVSHTTRKIGEHEVDGRDYHFVTEHEFSHMIEAGEFLEHAKLYGNRYGTSRKVVSRELEAGNNVVLEIDWQGARQVQRSFPAVIKVFQKALVDLQNLLPGGSGTVRPIPECIMKKLGICR